MPRVGDLVRRLAEQLLALEADGAGRRGGRDAHDRVAQRGLAHAVAADDRDRLLAHLERDVLERRAPARRSAFRPLTAKSGVGALMAWPPRATCRGRGRARAGSRGSRRASPRSIMRPSCIIVTLSATRRATSMSCSMMISVIDGSSASSRSVSAIRSPRERPEAGSSSIISFGSPVCAMPTSSWRCSPCESEPTSVPIWPAEPDGPRRARARARASRRRARASTNGRRWPFLTPSTPRYRLSSTLRPRKSRDFWYVRDMPILAR